MLVKFEIVFPDKLPNSVRDTLSSVLPR